jgi:hypothetical protein
MSREDNKYQVGGHIFLEYGLPAKGAEVRLYGKGFGGTEKRLGKGKTDEEGHFEVSYELDGNSTKNIQVRMVDVQGNEISISDQKFNPDKNEVLNLVAPAKVQPLEPEYRRLVADIEKHIGGSIERVSAAQEKDNCRDLSLLHQSTGWDARLIALLAKASKLSTEIGIAQDALYALYRVGLPTDKELLARLDISLVEKALEKAKRAGIISSDLSIESVSRDFQKFSRSVIRDQKAAGTLSSLVEILDKSGLDEENRTKFEELYFDHRGSASELWQKAKERGIPHEKIQGLRLQGKLSYLTLNNALLAEKLQQEIGSIDNLSKLVELDLYSEEAWKARLDAMAGTERLMEKIIPPAYKGEKIADRKSAYAADLARKVRLSFPTKVIRRMMEKGELNLGPGYDNEAVVTFLKRSETIGL